MRWETYEKRFREAAQSENLKPEKLQQLLSYAKTLHSSNCPIVFDQTHLSLLIGIDNEYLHSMSNAPEYFYRTFYIKKRNGKKRRIDEPLPDLKKVQSWILTEILYKKPCSKFAKAYIPKISIKENVRFHKNRKVVVTIDIKDFFPSIKSGHVLNVFLSMGYNLPVAMLLTCLCCYNGCLPQGAPTSAYLSNLVMNHFDDNISKYCVSSIVFIRTSAYRNGDRIPEFNLGNTVTVLFHFFYCDQGLADNFKLTERVRIRNEFILASEYLLDHFAHDAVFVAIE